MQEFLTKIRHLEQQSKSLVWWKPEQIQRGEHLRDDMVKGERPWIIPETTGRFLYDTITKNSYSRVLELGTSIGYSTLWLAYAVREYDGHVDTVERSDNKIPVATQNFIDMELDKYITQYHMRNNEFLEYLSKSPDKKYDLIFLDSDRGHYHEYLPILDKHLQSSGVIIADNAGNMSERMSPFLQALTEYGYQFEIINLDNGLLLARKNP